MGDREHWDEIYRTKDASELSWYRPHLERSLAFVRQVGLAPDEAMIDVGGGESTFVDDLLALGFRNVTVLDLSAEAIARTRLRLGPKAKYARWIVGDVTTVDLPEQAYDFWHDRAVFHFLIDSEARRRYVAAVRRAVRPGGHVLVATFGPEGPERCSGLPVVRYDSEALCAAFGAGFERAGSARELHQTSRGVEQEFVYCLGRVR